jgi:hypothetical protein
MTYGSSGFIVKKYLPRRTQSGKAATEMRKVGFTTKAPFDCAQDWLCGTYSEFFFCVLCTTISQNLRVTRKFSDIENISDSDIPLAKAQRRQVRKRIYFLKPLRLSAFARDIPRFGCGVAALGSLWLNFFSDSVAATALVFS